MSEAAGLRSCWEQASPSVQRARRYRVRRFKTRRKIAWWLGRLSWIIDSGPIREQRALESWRETPQPRSGYSMECQCAPGHRDWMRWSLERRGQIVPHDPQLCPRSSLYRSRSHTTEGQSRR